MAVRSISALPEKAVVGDQDLLLLIDVADSNKTKKTTIQAFQRKNFTKLMALSAINSTI